MSSKQFYRKYFAEETRGYLIMRRFYFRYADLFHKREFPQFEDFLNQIFVNLSDIDLERARKSEEGYVIGAIKIQCRMLLERAVERKSVRSESERSQPGNEDRRSLQHQPDEKTTSPEETFSGNLLLREIAMFRSELRPVEREVLNSLIDGKARNEIAQTLELKMNTLDTHIRRIRLRLMEFLERRGYESSLFERITRE